MNASIRRKIDITDGYSVLGDSAGETVLKEERKKRRMSQKELALKAGLSEPWIKQIEQGKEVPGEDARKRLRAALEQCPVHAAFGIQCNHKLPVPDDDELYRKRPLAPIGP